MMEHVWIITKFVLISQNNQNVKSKMTAIGINQMFVRVFLIVQITQLKIVQHKNGVQNYQELVQIIILLYVLNLHQKQLVKDLNLN